MSWTLEDLLPFEPRVYWRLFALENEAVWPAQPVVLAAAALLALCLIWGRRPSGRRLGPVLGAAWLWTGWHFVALRYGTVNWAAPTLAWGFYAEAALLAGLGLSGRIVFPRQGRSAWFGIGLLVAAALVWPALAPLDGRPLARGRGRRDCAGPHGHRDARPARAGGAQPVDGPPLCIAPVLWLAVSTLTLFTMDAWQGWAVLVALLAGLAAWAAPFVRKPS